MPFAEDLINLAKRLASVGVFVDESRPAPDKIRGNQLAISSTQAATGANHVETTLFTYTLPGGLVKGANKVIRVHTYGTVAANGNTKTVKLYFGSNAHTIISGAANGTSWWSYTDYLIQGRANQQRWGFSGFGGTVNAQTIVALTEDTSADVIIKVTGTNDSNDAANDIVFNYAHVELF